MKHCNHVSSGTDGGKHYLAAEIVKLMPPRVKNGNSPAADDPGYWS